MFLVMSFDTVDGSEILETTLLYLKKPMEKFEKSPISTGSPDFFHQQ